ncbi:serine/threonine-protein kinase LMTK3-like isoform X2 [Portunus trituberculatus]|uniref:serine/threonine-protein kinase LMTK3-like isoform X2 n=1 Tax=Portunus trituberculatus TaxID=210409 RepID=UPI001E1CE049|nr:serine/threonine-protein kinase LMTK3-like isoform X2 [Portunus trituberculatus]
MVVHHWNTGAGMCVSRAGGVVGVVGAALILLGLLQVVAGTYFMLALPIFQLGSNLWTGSWSVVCGLVVGVLAWRGRALRRGQVVLVATLSVLVANVANLVILQVGEKSEFLTEANRRTIVRENQEHQLRIALWLTTVVSAVGICVSFLGAQYLFCAVVRGPRVKGRMPVTRSLSDEDLQRPQEPQDSTPSLEDVVALPDPARSSAWVYNPEEDKGPAPLGPPGLDLLWDCPDGPRRLPAARHASFATARFARVHQRPQRAQSFVVRRDLLLSAAEGRPAMAPAPVRCPELPGTRTCPRYAKPNVRRIYRSNSVTDKTLLGEAAAAAAEAGAALSRRFHAGSLDDLDAGPVIEVGMAREVSRSEHTLATCRTSFCHAPSTEDEDEEEDEVEETTVPVIHRSATSVKDNQLESKTVLSSFNPVSGHAPPRLTKQKGPAPLPPTKPKPPPPPAAPSQDDQGPSGPTKPPDEGIEFSDEEKEAETRAPLPAIEENNSSSSTSTSTSITSSSSRKRPAPQPRSSLPTTSLPFEAEGETASEVSREPPPPPPPPPSLTKKAMPPKIPRPEIVKPPRPSVADKILRAGGAGVGGGRPPPARCRGEGEEAATLRRLEEVLTGILDRGAAPPLRATRSEENLMESLRAAGQEARTPKGILKNGPVKPSRYEQEHREALQDSRALLEQLPRGELQRHKIVLRVPSFRTAGCQTEASRPLRRRASCAQTGFSTAPRLRDAAATTTVTPAPPITTSSSSSSSSRSSLTDRSRKKSSPALESSSSSSGYSSPEVSSKAASPSHSGPPSPASSSVGVSDEEERRRRRSTDTNVTVIEVNKSAGDPPPRRPALWQGLDTVPPPRPPKPFRLRPLSDAGTLLSNPGGLLVPVPRRASQLYEDVFGLAALTENVMLLTEAINPVLVHTRGSDAAATPAPFLQESPVAPRVVDVIPKAVNSKLWDGRTIYAPRPRPALRTHSLSLPRPALHPRPPPPRLIRRVAEHPNDEREKEEERVGVTPESTAAYLASLELLASHYRHQALANAKQLQLQQRLLLQQQRQQQQQTTQDSTQTEYFEEEEEGEEDEKEDIIEKDVKGKKKTSPARVLSEPYLASPVKDDSEC